MNIRAFRSSGIVGALASRNFRIFIIGNFCAINGLWMQRLGLGWTIWELTQSGFWLGVVAFSDLFPVMLVGPFAGVIADRFDRRRVLIICKSLHFLQALALATLTYFGVANIEALVALALYGGFVMGTYQASRHAIVPSLVEQEHLSSAIALSSVVVNVCRFIGPAIAGLLLAHTHISAAFAVAALGHITLVSALLAIKPKPGEPVRHGRFLHDVLDGFQYILHHTTIKWLLAIEVVVGLCVRPTIELLPGFAGAVFERGTTGLAILTSSVGIGAIVGGLWLALRSGVSGLVTLTLGFLVSAGCVIVAFSAVDRLWLGALLIGSLGSAMVIASAGSQTLIQTAVDNHMRGRVLSIWGLAHRGVPAIGALAMGGVAEFMGFGPAVAGGGLVCIAAASFLLRRRALLVQLTESPLSISKPPDG